MDRFQLHILGCGAATPTRLHHPSAQVLFLRGKAFMIDCGEGAQLQLRRAGINFNKIGDIFISHLHGDHCFGLIGLISTMSLLGRTAPLRIHSHAELESILTPQLRFFCRELSYEVQFLPFSPKGGEIIYEDRSVLVYSLPLIHRIPSTGFLFKEKPRQPNIIKERIAFYDIPLRDIPAIKAGGDFITREGERIPHARLVRPAKASLSYAYCSDTVYNEALIPYLENVDCLYHEATFAQDQADFAAKTMHSTAHDAARLAKAAQVKRLLLGHFSARYDKNEQCLLDEAQKVFPFAELAQENTPYEIGPALTD